MPVVEIDRAINGEIVKIYVEVDEAPKSANPYVDTRDGNQASKVVTVARDMISDGLSLARHCATLVVDSLKAMDENVRPAEFQVQFAIKLDSEVGAILAKASAGAQLQVTMKWVADRPH